MWVDRLEQLEETLYVDQLDIPEEVKRCACVRACVRPYVHVCMWCLCDVCGVFRICKSVSALVCAVYVLAHFRVVCTAVHVQWLFVHNCFCGVMSCHALSRFELVG